MGFFTPRTARVKGQLPPGPRGLFASSNPFLSKSWLPAFERSAQLYGDVVFVRFFHLPMCLLFSPRAIEQVLVANSANFTKSRDYRAIAAIFGKGLLTNEGDAWLRQRKLIQPSFHHSAILQYAKVMSEFAERTVSGWRDGETRDIHRDMMRLTLEIVAATLFGSDVSGSAAAVGETLHEVMVQFPADALWAFLLPLSFPLPRIRRFSRSIRQLDELIYGMIRNRREHAGESRDLLQTLLDARDENGAPMSEKQLRDEMVTLFLAGHETTANALSWSIYLLAQNPEAEEKLVAELREVLAGRAPTADDLPRLRYTELALKEAMRLYPPAWGVGRMAKEEFEVEGYRLPKGTNVFVFQWVTHRDARFFPEPERFRPERWQDDPVRSGKLPRFAYFPFGGGPRVCIGAGFAMMEATLLLAAIMQRFHFELAPGHRVETLPSVTLRPKRGIHVILHQRA
jgi:cytochrome P450